ncbi:MAG: polysaccharide biosynthesis tyrosine autokinase [Muribaculaceae bacterium]|nr:polysaccharide biosynthesis tyrosine autokinase [Muribaculaceae bacterium]
MDYYSSKKKGHDHEEDEEQTFSLRAFFASCLRYWKWFLLSLIVFVAFGFFYTAKQEPVYQRQIEVLIQNHDVGGGTDISSEFKHMGFLSSKANVNNELLTMSSPYVVSKVVEHLRLDINYNKTGKFHPVTLYGSTNPLSVEFIDLGNEDNAGFKVKLRPDNTIVLYDFWKIVNGKKEEYDNTLTTRLSFSAIKSPIGQLLVQPNGTFTGKVDKEIEMNVWKKPFASTVEAYKALLKGDLADKDADVVELTITSVSPQIASDFLNTVVSVYNQNWITDRNRVTVATNEFINERLAVIESELGNVDADISRYKTDNMLPDMAMVTGMQLSRDQMVDQSLLDDYTQLSMAKYMRDFLFNPKNAGKVIPANLGLPNMQINTEIAEYNKLLIQYQQMMENSGPNNPWVKEYKASLNGMYEGLCSAMNGLVGSLETKVKEMTNAKGKNEEALISQPEKAKYLLSVERQQKVKEDLYIYLLEKREENELSKAFTAYNTRVIQPPYGSQSPISPKKSVIMAVCIFLGLVFPGVVIYFIEATNTKVRSRRDLDGLQIPFAGEIPYVGKKGFLSGLRQISHINKKNKQKEVDTLKHVVKKGERDLVNEAFRIVRGNIDFMMGKEETCILGLTSFNPGSGKSFIAFNLAEAFSHKDHRVLVIDGDLRHGSLSTYVGSPSNGLSNYLAGRDNNWTGMLVKNPDGANIDLLPIGNRPPNVAELLDNGKMEVLLEEARQRYDIILIDCPPVNIVVDTLIMSKYMDRTLFVVRANLLEKNLLDELKEFYLTKKYNNISVILNGVGSRESGYGYYGHYGYGYSDVK